MPGSVRPAAIAGSPLRCGQVPFQAPEEGRWQPPPLLADRRQSSAQQQSRALERANKPSGAKPVRTRIRLAARHRERIVRVAIEQASSIHPLPAKGGNSRNLDPVRFDTFLWLTTFHSPHGGHLRGRRLRGDQQQGKISLVR